jgi:spore germination protein YaaH
MKSSLTKIIAVLMVLSFVSPSVSSAATGAFEVAGWIPYWRIDDGTASARVNLDVLTHIYPFGYSVKEDGSLSDLADLKDRSWKRLFKSAASKDVEVMPTVMWSDGKAIHGVLSNPSKRKDHVNAITSMVKKGKYTGVDIDYEGKWAETQDHYSAFIKELKASLGSKTLTCTIEARTPPESLYATMPATLKYSNDYSVIGKYCDRVQLMTYDQGRADLKLNAFKTTLPYNPVSDVEWVRKVVELTVKTIPREKILLGVPTYGRRYEVTVSPNGYVEYSRLSSPNPDEALDIAKEFSGKPSRNTAGEIGFSYAAAPSPLLVSTIPVPAGTPEGFITAARASLLAKAMGRKVKYFLVGWSDAAAIKQKVDLAKEYNLRGVTIFKIDGGEDPALWDLFEAK